MTHFICPFNKLSDPIGLFFILCLCKCTTIAQQVSIERDIMWTTVLFSNGLFTLHGTGTGNGYDADAEMFTLVRDRDPLFPIVPVSFAALPLFLVPCSVNNRVKSLTLYITIPATKLRQGNVFTPVCDSVHMGGGGLCPNMHHRSHDRGALSGPPGQKPPPQDRVPPYSMGWAVRILLECILVQIISDVNVAEI